MISWKIIALPREKKCVDLTRLGLRYVEHPTRFLKTVESGKELGKGEECRSGLKRPEN